MKIVVLCKYIRDEEQITVNDDRSLCTEKAPWVISQYDLNAIEAAMRLARESEGEVSILTVGGEALDNSKMKKAALSRGPAKLYGIKTDECEDIFSTASLLKQGIDRIGDVDVVVCGEGSGDMYSQQMGNILGSLMDVPVLNSVSSLEYADGAVVAGRNNGERVETFKITGRAVLSVTSDICPTHIPSLKEIMGAGKKPVEIWPVSDFDAPASTAETGSGLAPEQMERMQQVFRESDENGVDDFVSAMRKYI